MSDGLVFPGRRVEGEVMDRPGLNPAAHAQALRGLARINAISGVVPRLARRLARGAGGCGSAARSAGSGRPLRVLDVACGGGDVAIGLARWAARAGLDWRVCGADVSETAVAYARAAAARRGVALEFVRLDALADPLPSGYDAMISTLFLHHLEDAAAGELLRRMGEATRRVLVEDLVRGRAAELAAWAGTRVLSRSPIVHADGPASVRAAFTVEELAALAEGAGLSGARLTRHWPWRMLLDWGRT